MDDVWVVIAALAAALATLWLIWWLWWLWNWRKKESESDSREVCDDCGRNPAITEQGTLLLCGSCAYHEDDEPDEYDGSD